MKALFILLLCAASSFTVFAQNRNVIWVHGLGSGPDFWNEYAAEFQQQRRIVSSNQGYNTANGVPAMAGDITNRTRGLANPQTIGIGHSMGGLSLREIDARTAPGHVGGFITVGSPLNGARLVNNVQNGQLTSYVSHGVDEMLKGPLRELLGAGYIVLNTGTRAFTGRSIIEVLLHEIGLDEILVSQLPASAPQLAENSQYMNGNNGMIGARQLRTTRPTISIYGNENSPVHFRLASSFTGRPDTHFPNIVRDIRGVYNAFYIKNVVTFFNIINISRAAGWKAGRDYLDSGSEKGWNNLTGATRSESRQSCLEEWVCGNDYSCYDNIVTFEDFLACEELCYQTRCRTITERYNQPSDGLLHLSTQLGQRTNITTSQWNPNATFEALGANHSEFDQHPGT
ncbi:MAG: esterase/lipase family protein, partial [Cyclobacteriaceae bacterium]